MGVNHSTPIPNPQEFDCQISEASSTSTKVVASLDDTAASCRFDFNDDGDFVTASDNDTITKSNVVSLSDEMKCCERPGQFYGMTLYNDKHTNAMNLVPMAEPPVTNRKSSTTTKNTPAAPSAALQQQKKQQQQQNQRLSKLQDEEPFFEASESADDDGSIDIIQAGIIDAMSTADDTDSGSVNSDADSCYTLSEGWRVTGQMDALGGRLFLRGARNQLVAMVVRTLKGYLILGRQPLYEGQYPHKKILVDDKFMYEHALIKKKPISLLRLGSTWMIERPKPPSKDDANEQQSQQYYQYVANSCGPMFSSNMIRVNEVSSGKPCALVSQYFANNDVLDSRWDLLVGPGVDPCLMVCFVGILNKGMGKTAP